MDTLRSGRTTPAQGDAQMLICTVSRTRGTCAFVAASRTLDGKAGAAMGPVPGPSQTRRLRFDDPYRRRIPAGRAGWRARSSRHSQDEAGSVRIPRRELSRCSQDGRRGERKSRLSSRSRSNCGPASPGHSRTGPSLGPSRRTPKPHLPPTTSPASPPGRPRKTEGRRRRFMATSPEKRICGYDSGYLLYRPHLVEQAELFEFVISEVGPARCSSPIGRGPG